MNGFPDEQFPDEINFDETETELDELEREVVKHRGNADPAFGFLLAVALSVGLIPMLPDNADLRYTLAWGALAGVSVLGWLLGNAERIEQETPDNIAWGVAFGVMVSVPFIAFFLDIFRGAANLIFPNFGSGTVLAYLVFVMPLAETLFFRGALQRRLEFWIVGSLAGLWSVLLFFPVMWGEVLPYTFVAIFLAIALFALNMMYSYVRERNGLAAAWVCQITANLILFFVPYLFVAQLPV
jgi:membrane protease YdiL (CAAX protease family)